MNVLIAMNWAGVGIQSLMFIFVMRAYKKGAHFNPLTYLIFMGLSVVTTAVTYFEKGNWLLPMSWIACDSIIGIYLIKAGETIRFGKSEKWLILCALVSAGIYVVSKRFEYGILAVWACTFSLCFACWPVMTDYKNNPEGADPLVWILYSASNMLCFLGVRPFNVENSLVSGSQTALCLMIMYWIVKCRVKLRLSHQR